MCRADFCANFLPSLVCQTCITYFVLDKSERCIADCAVGNVTRCQCCKYGYTLNVTTGYCQPLGSYCTKNNTNTGLCDGCFNGYILLSGQCVAPVQNCRTPSMFGCLSCNPGYDLMDNCRCVPKYCNQVGINGQCVACHPRFEVTS